MTSKYPGIHDIGLPNYMYVAGKKLGGITHRAGQHEQPRQLREADHAYVRNATRNRQVLAGKPRLGSRRKIGEMAWYRRVLWCVVYPRVLALRKDPVVFTRVHGFKFTNGHCASFGPST